MQASDFLSIGQLAGRVGVSVSAIRFYESRGLIASERNRGGQRRFRRSDIRRLAFIQITQGLGFTIAEIADVLASLPENRTPNKADWSRISKNIQIALDERITELQRLRTKLDGCIGCGCLSLEVCNLYNPQDRAATEGAGPRYLIAEPPR
jgi:MerR family redox-sensitive transcriptional activator SoxR